ncbi:MAG TPA: FmdB family transcriptional regulator [Anaerolineales bacterium]|nr:FmdB family transcriptional regulator [Anaerolineales bacterium]
MPTYEYTCTICGAKFEKQLHFGDNTPHITCPNGHRQVRRRFSAPGIVFKGSGFYITDNRKSSSPAQAKA